MLGATSSQHSPKHLFPLRLRHRPNKAPPSGLLVSATAQPRRQLQASNQETQSLQLKGLDVLRAMQRAAAEKNRVRGKSKKKGSVVKSIQKEEEDVNYSNVTPLMVKSEWSFKLDEFEKLLKELSETK